MQIKKEVTIVTAGAIALMSVTIYATSVLMHDKLTDNIRERKAIALGILATCDQLDVQAAQLKDLIASPDAEGVPLPGADRMASVGCVKVKEGTGSVQ